MDTVNEQSKIQSQDPLVGKVIMDRYLILSVVGEGGWGVVYKAQHQALNKIVAIKTLHLHLARDAEKIKRFEQEARATSGLNHENIAQVYDFGTLNGDQPYFVMDFVQGNTLGALLKAQSPLPQDRAVGIFKQVCNGLAAAHSCGVIHRDIKPNNIFVMEDPAKGEVVRLIDFGLAKLVTPDGSAKEYLTLTGEVVGTPPYMSPEQCLGRQMDARTDIYSLGCVMYEALTGVQPFTGASAFECMTMQVSETPPAFSQVCQHKISDRLEDIVFKCIEKDPEHRYQSVEELLSDLEKADLTSSRSRRLKRRSTTRGGKKKAAGVAAVVFALAIGLMSGLVWNDHTTPPAGRQAPVFDNKPIEVRYKIDIPTLRAVKVAPKEWWLESKLGRFVKVPDQEAADEAMKVIRHYGCTEWVTIGSRESDDPELTFFLTPQGLPKGPMEDEDAYSVDLSKVKAQFIGKSWKVSPQDQNELDFDNDADAAKAAAAAAHKYGFRYECWLYDSNGWSTITFYRE